MQNLTQQEGNNNKIQYIHASNVSMQEPQIRNQEEQQGRSTYSQGNTRKSTRNTETGDQNTTLQKSGIIAIQLNSFNVLKVNDEVTRGMEGGCQDKLTNMQERGTKGGNFPHVMHGGWIMTIE